MVVPTPQQSLQIGTTHRHRQKLHREFFNGVKQNVSSWPVFWAEVVQDDMCLDFNAVAVAVRIQRSASGADDQIIIDADQPNMSDKEFEAYLDLGNSTSRDRPERVGCRGQGERLSILSRARTLRLIALADNGPERVARDATLDVDQWVEGFIDQEKAGVEWSVVSVPPDFPFAHGRRIIISHFFNPIPSNEELKAYILRLEARCVERITFNGEKLRKPTPRGTRRAEEWSDFPGLGKVSIDLVLPDTVDTMDELYIGVTQPVMTLSEFLRQLRESNRETSTRVERVLYDRRPKGTIYIMGLKSFKTQATKGGFDDSLFRSDEGKEMCRKVVEFLNGQVKHRLENILNEKEAEIVSQNVSDAFKQVAAEINAAEGRGAPTPGGGAGAPTPLNPYIRPLRRQVECGDTIPFNIFNVETNDTVVWDASQAGGVLNTTTGHAVTFTAGQTPSPPDGNRLLARVTRAADGAEADVSAKIYIHRGRQPSTPRGLRIKPSTMELYAGDPPREARLENTAGSSGRFHWESDDPSLVDVDYDPNNSTKATITAGHPTQPVVVHVRVFDRDNPKVIKAEMVVKIIKEERVPTGGDKPGGIGGDGEHQSPFSKTIPIDSVDWEVTPAVMAGPPIRIINEGEMRMDPTHALFKQATSMDALIQTMREWIAFAYGEWKSMQQITGEESATQIAARLLQRWLPGGSQPTAGGT